MSTDSEWSEPFQQRGRELASELESIVETLNELVVDHLREAVANEVSGRPPFDKTLQSARRAVEKAVHLLDR